MEIKREADTEKPKTWGTWEELLLASAVKRHGSKNWDSVALEVQARTILPATALACKQKYLDLHRRFSAGGNGDSDAIPWLEDLRKLRVAELRQDVQRYDVSILSLQSKVKRLEEERERSADSNGNGHGSPDLEEVSKENLSGNDKKPPGKPEHEAAGKSVSGEETDRENRSVNESNSSGAKCDNPDKKGDVDRDREPARTGSEKPDPALSASMAAVEDSYNGSSEPNGRRRGEESAELRDSVGQSKESSDVQSSASLTRKRKNRWRKQISGGEEPAEMEEDSERIAAKSGPLVGLLEAIRTQKHSSVFERRLQSQENDKYKKTVRQHVDLETIEKRVEEGSYSSCTLSFYRDLMLMFSNATVFFPKCSPESVSAHQLRDTVSMEMHKHAHRPDPPQESAPSPSPPQPKPEPERSDSLLAKHKSSAPIIVCRKRSSISAKPSSTTTSFGSKTEEKKPPVDPKAPPAGNDAVVEEQSSAKEKPVTGTRTMRRGLKTQAPNSATTKKQNGSPEKVGTMRTEKKKAEALASEKKKSAADFLKRIKRNSSVESPKSGKGEQQQKKNSIPGKAENKGKERVVKGKQSKDESSPSKRSVGRPPKKVVEAAPAKRGRGEAAAGKEPSASKRPKKRAKR